jgi:cell division protein FtsB
VDKNKKARSNIIFRKYKIGGHNLYLGITSIYCIYSSRILNDADHGKIFSVLAEKKKDCIFFAMESRINLLNPLRWKRSFLMAIAGFFLFVWFGFIDTYSILTRFRLSRQKSELQARTEALKKQIDEIEQKISSLESDPNVVERIAREKYGMRRKGETVYRIQEK